jgi:hypothetical protein
MKKKKKNGKNGSYLFFIKSYNELKQSMNLSFDFKFNKISGRKKKILKG